MTKRTEHAETIQAFHQWLLTTGRASPSTASLYSATVSAAIHKHAVGWTDKEGLTAYLVRLATQKPAQARSFSAAWGHFGAFMRGRGVEVPTLPAPGRIYVGPPPAAVHDLRACLNRMPPSSFVDLRWGQVRTTPDRSVHIDVLYNTGKSVTFLLSTKGVEALALLKAWAWPRGVPSAGAHLVPDTPGSEMGITPQALSRLMKEERARRASVLVLEAAPSGGGPSSDTTVRTPDREEGTPPTLSDADRFDELLQTDFAPAHSNVVTRPGAPSWEVDGDEVVFEAPESFDD